MLDAAKSPLLGLSALFPIVAPLESSAFFLALTSDYAPDRVPRFPVLRIC